MTSLNIEVCFETALELVKTAGKFLEDEFNKSEGQRVDGMQTQHRLDFSTKADKESEAILLNGLTKAFPTHLIMAEESSKNGKPQPDLTNDITWIIDPLDGTMNFVHGYPMIAISVALFMNKKPLIGIIFNPIGKQLFTAKTGQGAFLNGKRIFSSANKDLTKSLIAIDLVTFPDVLPIRHSVMKRNLDKLVGVVHSTRIIGSAALSFAMVAMGSCDAYFELGIKAWDMAAGQLMVQEAGGCVIDFEGGPFDVMNRRVICAGSKELAKQLSETLEPYDIRKENPNI